ncbi:cistern family PEP-CTERM protein [Qipengyuania soli]|nr:cistern family PEP-CTERM protein [Qipengyuania soli]
MNFKRFITSAMALIGLATATPAIAEPILLDSGSVGDSFTIDFDGFVNGGPSLDGLNSSLTLTLTAIENGIYTFDYSLTNTGAADDGITSRVSGFAFNTDPDIDAATSTGTYGYTNTDSNYPNGIGTVDVCFQAQSTGSCAGGGSGGVYDGATGTGTLSLSFGTAPASLTLDDFFVRYQSISGIDGVTSASGRQITSTSSSGGNDVPEPGMVLLFGMAVLAIAFGARGRGQAATKVRVAYA